MQSWKMGRMMVRLAIVILALAFSLVFFGCSSDDDDDGDQGPVDVGTNPVDLTRATAPMLNGETFNFSNGKALDPGLTGDPTSVTFRDLNATTGLGTATVSSGNSTANAVVAVASLTFTWTTSNFPAGEGPQSLGRIVIARVEFQVSADGVIPGGDAVEGTLRLIIFSADGDRFTAEVSVSIVVDDAGILFVNGINTGIDVADTGLTGSGN